MKKPVILLIIVILAAIFMAGCVLNTVSYCPYCSSMQVEKTEDGWYKCNNCTKTFGVKEL